MSKCIFVRKVPFKLPPKNRLVWGMELVQRQGVSLLFVRKPDDKQSHSLVVATENVKERVFEPVSLTQFPLEDGDLSNIAECFETLSSNVRQNNFPHFFNFDDFDD